MVFFQFLPMAEMADDRRLGLGWKGTWIALGELPRNSTSVVSVAVW